MDVARLGARSARATGPRRGTGRVGRSPWANTSSHPGKSVPAGSYWHRVVAIRRETGLPRRVRPLGRRSLEGVLEACDDVGALHREVGDIEAAGRAAGSDLALQAVLLQLEGLD